MLVVWSGGISKTLDTRRICLPGVHLLNHKDVLDRLLGLLKLHRMLRRTVDSRHFGLLQGLLLLRSWRLLKLFMLLWGFRLLKMPQLLWGFRFLMLHMLFSWLMITIEWLKLNSILDLLGVARGFLRVLSDVDVASVVDSKNAAFDKLVLVTAVVSRHRAHSNGAEGQQGTPGKRLEMHDCEWSALILVKKEGLLATLTLRNWSKW